MDTSGQVDVVRSGLVTNEQSHEDDNRATLPSSKQSAIPGSSPVPDACRHSSSTIATCFKENVNGDSENENNLKFLKSNTDSDESNESGSLPSKSSSTIDTLGSHEKDDQSAVKIGTRIKSSRRKKDRSKLRKGKWTVRLFSVGSFNLPANLI